MNISNGMLVSPSVFGAMPTEEKKNYIQVKRDLTKLESANMQIKIYSPCGCGSGKKFKFCCKR